MNTQQQATTKVGTKGTYAGFPATVIRHYYEDLYVIRVPGGVTCVDIREFVPASAQVTA